MFRIDTLITNILVIIIIIIIIIHADGNHGVMLLLLFFGLFSERYLFWGQKSRSRVTKPVPARISALL